MAQEPSLGRVSLLGMALGLSLVRASVPALAMALGLSLVLASAPALAKVLASSVVVEARHHPQSHHMAPALASSSFCSISLVLAPHSSTQALSSQGSSTQAPSFSRSSNHASMNPLTSLPP